LAVAGLEKQRWKWPHSILLEGRKREGRRERGRRAWKTFRG